MANLNTRSREQRTYDAIVVGSGMTGGWAAKELTEKGLRTLVLERGRKVRHIADYPTAMIDPWNTKYPRGKLPPKMLAEHYPQQQRTGYALTEYSQHWFVKDDEEPYTRAKDFGWIRGYHVGGRSLMWSRQTYRHSVLDFESNAREGIGVGWPIRYEDIAPWYTYVEKFAGISGKAEGLAELPDSYFQPEFEMNAVEKAFKARIEEKIPGRKVINGRCAHLTAPTEEQKAIGRGRCLSRNLCIRGCPFGAYFSSNSATLPAAERTGKLTLQPDAVVTAVVHDANTSKATGVRALEAETGEEVEFYAKVIFLCASTLNSAWLLLNSTSDRFPNGFGNGSDQVGRNIMDHIYNVGASANAPEFNDRYYSGRRPTGVFVPRFRNLDDAASRRKDYIRGFSYQSGASRFSWDRKANAVGFGADFKEELTQPGEWQMRLGGIGEVLPYADNRATLNHDVRDKHGLPTLTMDVSLRENELAMRKDMKEAAAEMLQAAGFTNVQMTDTPYVPGLGIHEMGSARMGRDPKTSVLNGFNQMHECANVYITDGSCMASASCVNPSLTYMALTARACDHAVSELRKGNL